MIAGTTQTPLRKLSNIKAVLSDIALTGQLTGQDLASEEGRAILKKYTPIGAGFGALAGLAKGIYDQRDSKKKNTRSILRNIGIGAGIGAGLGLAGAVGRVALPHIKAGRYNRYVTGLQRGAEDIDPEGYPIAKQYSKAITDKAHEVNKAYQAGKISPNYARNLLSYLGQQKMMADAYITNLKYKALSDSSLLRNVGSSLVRW